MPESTPDGSEGPARSPNLSVQRNARPLSSKSCPKPLLIIGAEVERINGLGRPWMRPGEEGLSHSDRYSDKRRQNLDGGLPGRSHTINCARHKNGLLLQLPSLPLKLLLARLPRNFSRSSSHSLSYLLYR
jgi:hypothetical protein